MKAEGKQIGKPGGTLRMMIGQGSDARSLLPFAYSRLIVYDENYRLVPDILASFDVQDGRIFTFHLRDGHRWSDGSPFTTEDFRYYWEDIATNPKLSPDGLPPALLVNGMPPQVDILDQTTIRYSWALPNQAFLPALAAATPLMIYPPGPLPEAVQSQIHQLQGDHAVPGRQPSSTIGTICTSISTIRCCWAIPTCRRWGPGPPFRAAAARSSRRSATPTTTGSTRTGSSCPISTGWS